jgi:hypothetical protein
MTRFSLFLRTAALGALLLATLGSAQAASVPEQQAEAYKKMCMQAATMPKPYGEWDLKGNPKLGKYCDCFSPLFAARAMKAAQYMQQNPGKGPPGTLEESNKEELAMRNTCRKQVGLPAAVAP